MSDFTVEQLTDPQDTDIAGVLNLFKGIAGRTCSAAAYLDYLNTNWILLAVFVVRKDGVIVGFTQAQAPSILDPKTAWLPYSHASRECPRYMSDKAVKLATDWMKGFGATKFKIDTNRSTRAMRRSWHMKMSKDQIMEKDI